MSAPALPPPTATLATALHVHLRASGEVVCDRALAMLRHPDVVVTTDLAAGVDAVVLAAPTIEEAIAQRPPWCDARMVVVAETFSREGVLRALRSGVTTMLRFARTTPDHLTATLRDGGDRLPHDVLVRLLGGGGETGRTERPAPAAPRLTRRHLTVLRLVAEGFDNAGVARELGCSEHTVKNVIYEVMAQLHARNRAHAVAAAVRLSLI